MNSKENGIIKINRHKKYIIATDRIAWGFVTEKAKNTFFKVLELQIHSSHIKMFTCSHHS